MARRIYFDGLNLSLERGTGIATYTRTLARVADGLGYEVGLVFSSPHQPPRDPLLRDITFLDPKNAAKISLRRGRYNWLVDQARYLQGVKIGDHLLSGAVIVDKSPSQMPRHDHLFVERNLFRNARDHFAWSGRFAELAFDNPPDIMHCTYQLPLRAKGAQNIYTIHDLIPLRVPYTTLDNKRETYRLLRKIAADADHIVTVSEHSRRDIMQLLGVPADRVTNTYESVEFPQEYVERSDAIVAEQLQVRWHLEKNGYLLFYGAFEPKKNVGRLIDAYLLSAVDIPLVITGPPGWGTETETALLNQLRYDERMQRASRRRFFRIEYVSRSLLVTLVKGARAVLFPSLYEGFGLPVLEAMMLGTPVVTSQASSLPEIAGDAALCVDPYDVDAIAQAIKTITADDGLRQELSRRGRVQAQQFSIDRYRERIAALYERIG